MINSAVKAALDRVGYRVVKKDTPKEIIRYGMVEDEFQESYERVRPYTKTTALELYNLYEAVRYVVSRRVPGDFVECGVWKGGSMLMMALTLLQLGDRSRKLYLYDTFEGMPASTSEDINYSGMTAEARRERALTRSPEGWMYASFDEVKRAVLSTGYPEDRVAFVRGMVEDTIPGTSPEQIAILRLDTDFYSSTKHELEYLYPRLSHGGVLIIDDYDDWLGARQATDDYFGNGRNRPFLSRMDVGRLAIKCG